MCSTHSQSQLTTATPVSSFVQCQVSFGYCLHQAPHLFYSKLFWCNHMSVAEWMIHVVFITEGFFQVAIESRPAWDLNPQSLNSVQTLLPTELSGHEFKSQSEPTLCSYLSFILCSVSGLISAIAFISRHVCFSIYIYIYIYILIYIYIYKCKEISVYQLEHQNR